MNHLARVINAPNDKELIPNLGERPPPQVPSYWLACSQYKNHSMLDRGFCRQANNSWIERCAPKLNDFNQPEIHYTTAMSLQIILCYLYTNGPPRMSSIEPSNHLGISCISSLAV
jgi:hypothetical protein